MKRLAIIATFVAATLPAAAQAPSPVKWSIQKAPASAQAGQTIAIQFAAQIEKIPGSQQLVIADAEHFFEGKQDELTRIIVAFLDRVLAGKR